MNRREIIVRLSEKEYAYIKEVQNKKNMTFFEILQEKMDHYNSISNNKEDILLYVRKSINFITNSMRNESDQEYLDNLDSNLQKLESIIAILKEKNAEK